MSGAMAGFDAIVPLKRKLRLVLQTPLFQSGTVSLTAGTGIADVKRAADECDFLVADSSQVRDGVDRSLPVIGLYDIGFQAGAGSHQQYDRNPGFVEHPPLSDRECARSLVQDDSVHPL